MMGFTKKGFEFQLKGNTIIIKYSDILYSLILVYIGVNFIQLFSILFAVTVHELGHMRRANEVGHKGSVTIGILFGYFKPNDKIEDNGKLKYVLWGGVLRNLLYTFIFGISSLISYISFGHLTNFFITLTWVNLIMLLNLLPIYPTDGAKLLETLLIERGVDDVLIYKILLVINMLIFTLLVLFLTDFVSVWLIIFFWYMSLVVCIIKLKNALNN